MITKKTKYALKALATLAVEYQHKRPVLISELAERDKIPKKFLEMILLELKNKAILLSKKGKGGGYLLARSPEQIQLVTIMRALEGPLAPLSCLSKTAHAKCDGCESEQTCGLKMIMKEVYEMQIAMLEKLTLNDLTTLQAQLKSKADSAPMYHI